MNNQFKKEIETLQKRLNTLKARKEKLLVYEDRLDITLFLFIFVILGYFFLGVDITGKESLGLVGIFLVLIGVGGLILFVSWITSQVIKERLIIKSEVLKNE